MEELLSEDTTEIITAIKDYSKAYQNLENIQDKYSPDTKKKSDIEKSTFNKNRLIPKGDQKTGVVGEFFGRLILLKKLGYQSAIIAENHSQKGYDIIAKKKTKKEEYIQVKTVSKFSKYRKTSKVKTHDENGNLIHGILLIELNKDLISGKFELIKITHEIYA